MVSYTNAVARLTKLNCLVAYLTSCSGSANDRGVLNLKGKVVSRSILQPYSLEVGTELQMDFALTRSNTVGRVLYRKVFIQKYDPSTQFIEIRGERDIVASAWDEPIE